MADWLFREEQIPSPSTLTDRVNRQLRSSCDTPHWRQCTPETARPDFPHSEGQSAFYLMLAKSKPIFSSDADSRNRFSLFTLK
jgi:hypothetical protein